MESVHTYKGKTDLVQVYEVWGRGWKEKDMKWWVAGSRSIRNFNLVNSVLAKHVRAGDTIRTGGAQGVDRIAENWAKYNGIMLEKTLKPDWKMGRGAGMIRNTEGVDWADKVIVVWDGKSRGSLDVIKKCSKMGKPYHVYKT